MTIDEAKEALFLVVTGTGVFDITADWDAMPGDSPIPPDTPTGSTTEISVSADYGQKLSAINIDPTPSDSQSLGLSGVELDPREKAIEALKALDQAMAKVNSYRGGYGSLANRFESTLNSLAQTEINTAAAQSRIVDVDFAEETFNLTRAGILQQAGTAILTQANQTPQAALSLLGS
jgi:flagellin